MLMCCAPCATAGLFGGLPSPAADFGATDALSIAGIVSPLISVDTPNLFAAGRTADGDQMAGASLRVMGTAFATGQACGVAAAHYAQHGRTEAAAVREALRGQGALINGDDLPDPVALVKA